MGVAQEARASSIEMPPMTKFDKKVLFLFFQFVLASLRKTIGYTRTTVINNK